MMQHILTSILLSFFPLIASAQTIDSIFVSAPNEVLPLLERNSRLDLLDLYNCNMTAKVYNDLSGEACLLKKDSTEFFIQTTAKSYLQLKVLARGTDTLFSCIRTVEVPEEQSQIVFLDTNWNPVRIDFPKDIEFEHFWSPADSLGEDRTESLRLALQPAYIHMHWATSGDGLPMLEYKVSVRGIQPADREDALRCLRSVKYVWKQGKFEMIE